MQKEIENVVLALQSAFQMCLYTGVIAIPVLWLLKRVFYGRQK